MTAEPQPVAQEIVAWRGWRLWKNEDEAPTLGSVAHDCYWRGPTKVADEVPRSDSTHGLYARRLGVSLGEYAGQVTGEVALSGIVIEGENGYRAERAVIRSLCIRQNPFPGIPMLVLADLLATRYQCEVTWDEQPMFASDKWQMPQMSSATTQSYVANVAGQAQQQAYLQGYYQQQARLQAQAMNSYYGQSLLGNLGNLLP